VLLAPRIKVSKYSLPPPFGKGDHESEGNNQYRGDEEEHPRIDTTQEKYSHRDDRNHKEGSHIGFGKQEQSDDGDRRRHGKYCTKKALLDRHAAHHVSGCVKKDGELGHFGWLEAHESQRDPAPGAIHHDADARDEHQDEQYDRSDEEPRGYTLPCPQRYLKNQQCSNKTRRPERSGDVQENGSMSTERSVGYPAKRSMPNTP
jgi:hypothetical protein